MRAASPLTIDLAIHAVAFLIQFLMLFPQGFDAAGSTPAYVYPFWLILSTINIFRIKDEFGRFETNLVYIPQALASLLIGFCLINEIGAVYWAFYIPRWHAVWVRLVWYQSVLLLIHPHMFPYIQTAISNAMSWLKRRGYFRAKLLITLFVVGAVLWLLRSQNLSPDGYDWLKHSIYPKNWVRYLREPMGTFFFRLWVYYGMDWFHFAPHMSIALLTIGCGFITTAIMVPVVNAWFEQDYRGYVLALLLSTYGYVQIFDGNIEIYALLHTSLAVFLFFTMRYYQDRSSVWPVGITFGIMFCVHLSAGWWLPAFVLLPWFKHASWKPDKKIVADGLKLAAGFLAVTVSFGLFVLWYGYGWDFTALYNHFWSDQVMLVGTDAAMFRPFSDYADIDFYWTMLNEYYCMMPGGCILLLTLLMGFRWMKPACRIEFWFLILAGFYFIYSLTWRPDRHFPADWDLFSGLTIPAILCIGFAAARLKIKTNAAQYILYQCAVFSMAFLLLQLIRNHLKITDWPFMI